MSTPEKWFSKLQAIAQNGLNYTRDPFDKERYQQLQELTAEIGSALSQLDKNTVLELISLESGHATPKIDVRGVIIQNNKILLTQERSDQHWSLPGGWAEAGNTPAENVVKEIFEETGYQAKAVRLLAFYDKAKHHHRIKWPAVYKAFFLCEIIGGTPNENIETMNVDFFSLDELPPLSEDRVNYLEIQRMFELYQHPEWPSDFD